MHPKCEAGGLCHHTAPFLSRMTEAQDNRQSLLPLRITISVPPYYAPDGHPRVPVLTPWAFPDFQQPSVLYCAQGQLPW